MYCPAGNAIDPIWRVLASSLGISSWTPLKPQHSNPNPNPLANQFWSVDFLTPPILLIIPHRLPAFRESLMPLKNWYLLHARSSKSSLKHFIRFCGIFSKFKTEFYCISFFLSPDCISEIHKLWQSGFRRVYSYCCCSCSFEPEIINIGQSSHTMYSNKILNFQESMTVLNTHTKKVWKRIVSASYMNDKYNLIKWNCSNYCYVSLTTELNILHLLYTAKWSFQTVQFRLSHLFALSLQTILFDPYIDPIRFYHSKPEGTGERWQWRGALYFPKFQNYWSLTINFLMLVWFIIDINLRVSLT